MPITIISVSAKQPGWVEAGFQHYAKRLSGACRLELKEVPLAKRVATATQERVIAREGERMLAAVPKAAHVVALQETGRSRTTLELAERLSSWLDNGAPIALLVGGPDGLAPSCLERANEAWSLSPLTLPHGMVRIVVAEALYRAWTVLQGHPYHRG